MNIGDVVVPWNQIMIIIHGLFHGFSNQMILLNTHHTSKFWYIWLFNTYIQFNKSIFKQILGIPMGGNASPFIADLYLSWCEYCYMTKVVKSDYTLAKLLSYNCRYLDDICTINLQNFGDIAKDIYDNTLLLEGSICSYKQDTFLDLYIRVVDYKFITGIYHKVDDFNFEVILFHKAMFTRC